MTAYIVTPRNHCNPRRSRGWQCISRGYASYDRDDIFALKLQVQGDLANKSKEFSITQNTQNI